MPDDPDVHQNNKPIEPNPPAPKPARPKGAALLKWLASFTGRIGITWFLLLGFALLVGVALYLDWRQPRANTAKPTTELIVVQLNDIYRLDAVRAGKRGGLARVVTLLRRLKDQNPEVPVIVVHAGDFLSPSLESNLFHGIQMVDAMNFINQVADLYVVPGNHEFDYKDDPKHDESAYLTDAIFKSKFHWIVSNIDRNNAAVLQALRDRTDQHRILPFGKLKLGIFGLTIHGVQNGGDRSYAPISGDYARIAGEEIKYLEGAGADLIVGLTHLNIGDDHELAKLKQQHPRFLWIAGGHEHSLDREPGWSGAALITKGDSNARTVWKVAVMRNGENIEVQEESIPIDETIEPDATFTQDIEKFYRMKVRNVRPYMDTEVATIPNRCYDGTEEAVRDRESDWADFLTDTMRTAYKGIPVDVAVLNGGSIRIDDSICDHITFENLERTFAYSTSVVLVKLKGKDLRERILEDSVGGKRGDGRFLQISGVSFRREPSASGNQVMKDLQIQSAKGQSAFDDNKTYVVAVNEYIFNCGDKYDFRQYVTDYIPAGPDLRALTYVALSSQAKNKNPTVGRIIDLPAYVKLSIATPKWQGLRTTDRPCPKSP
jgi:5'-nucleotidase/UDP-sugar diphosphatase